MAFAWADLRVALEWLGRLDIRGSVTELPDHEHTVGQTAAARLRRDEMAHATSSMRSAWSRGEFELARVWECYLAGLEDLSDAEFASALLGVSDDPGVEFD